MVILFVSFQIKRGCIHPYMTACDIYLEHKLKCFMVSMTPLDLVRTLCAMLVN